MKVAPLFFLMSDAVIADQGLEAHARALASQVRCPVCQGQSIEDSNAPLALELKSTIREQLSAGHTDEQVLSGLECRYGAQVLLKPPFRPDTYLLWFTPFFLVILMGGFLLRIFSSKRK